MAKKTDRRSFLNKTLLGAAGVGAAVSLEERILLAAVDQGQASPQAGQGSQAPKPDIDPASMPCGKIGNVTVSRLFLGGNLIGGFSHSRDLLYVSKLFTTYNTEAKIFETLALAEACGINTVLVNPNELETVLKYKQRGGKIQTMVCVTTFDDPARTADQVKRLVDQGTTMLYTHGEQTDRQTMAGRIDVIGHTMDLIKAHGIPAGIGSHSLETPIAAEKNKLNHDFYVKTFHMDRYWSATAKENREEWCWYKTVSEEIGHFHDNMWCLDPDKTAAFMQTVEKPWVAFKVMAAGAIHPQMAFNFAYRNGADFIVAGMFDFQIEQDAKIAIRDVPKYQTRARPWRG